MSKKNQKFVALFRTQWTSAKATVPAAALRRCDFSKGLGPLLDSLEKKWDAVADLDPVPAKSSAELSAQIVKFQKVLKEYQAQVIKANHDDPGNGPGWFALHEALRKIDDGLVSDMKAIGVKCIYTKGWAPKEDFNRTAGKIGPGDGAPADSSDYRKRGFASLDARVAKVSTVDPIAFTKSLDDGLRTCLPHARELVKSLARYTGALVTTAQDFRRHLAAKQADVKQAAADVARAKQIAKALVDQMPPEGKPVSVRVNAMITAMDKTLATAGK
jgi:hypothetical protein